ncbi:MAG: T9SS C-terminal target domain-containing protein [Calditrichaeota bacterium]|nr:MAG: T9SS C-terminal target domain-containing protein [Calditrichota bacterium]
MLRFQRYSIIAALFLLTALAQVDRAFAAISVKITYPLPNSRLEPCQSIKLQAEVQGDSPVKDVTFFYYPNRLIRKVGSEPWQYEWKNVKSGWYQFSARARDASDNEFWSETVSVLVGDVTKGEILLNRGFDCETYAPWNFGIQGGVKATAYVMNDAYFDDSTYFYLDIEEGTSTNWYIQFSQRTGLFAGHTYEVRFIADADEDKPIAFNWQENGNDWTVHWQTDVIITDPLEYGPFIFECTEDDPTAEFKFLLAGNNIDFWLDSVSIIDLNATAVEQEDQVSKTVDAFTLLPCFPNPFNMETSFQYQLFRSSFVQLVIFDMRGRAVKHLLSQIEGEGLHTVHWDGRTDDGAILPSGLYLYQLSAGTQQSQSAKLLLIK